MHISVYAFYGGGCIREDSIVESPSGVHSQTIPVEKALSNLSGFLASTGNTKALEREIESISVVGGRCLTKALGIKDKVRGDYSFPDTLAYIVNFKNELGAALIAANECLSVPVLCVLDTGHLSSEDFDLSSVSCDSTFVVEEDREMLDDEPDTLLFAYRLDGEFATEAMSMYMLQDAMSVGRGDDEESSSSGNSGAGSYKWGPYIETKWGQGSPFSDMSERDVIGCAATATAQVLAYLEPDVDMCFCGIQCDWTTIKTVQPYYDYSYKGSSDAQKQVAAFCEDVARYKNCNVRTGGKVDGGAVATGIKRTLINYGVSDVHKYCGFGRKNSNRAKEMLKSGKPVLLGASTPRSLKGHCFILDGYYIDNANEYFHINWGWNGAMDGYYTCGVFDTNKMIFGDKEFDNSANQIDYYVSWLFRMISYNN